MSFSDIQSAIRMRELITQIAEGVVERLRPEERIGKVYSYSKDAQVAQIYFPGETLASLVTVRFALDKIPSKAMIQTFSSDGYNAAGDIVRIAGKPGSYYILDYVAGAPQEFKGLSAVATGIYYDPHSNPSFDTVISSTYKNGTNNTTAERLVPANWDYFWGDVECNYSADNTTWNGASGYSLKMNIATGKSQRAFSSRFSVKAGSIITMTVRVKSTGPGIELGVMTGTSTTFGFFDGDPNTNWQSGGDLIIPNDNTWRQYTYTAVVPTGRNKAMVNVRGTSIAGSSGDIWFDDVKITVDESGLITNRDIVATNDLKGKQLYVNDRRIYEAPVMGGDTTFEVSPSTNLPNDSVLRTLYTTSGVVIPAGSRLAVVSFNINSVNIYGSAACSWQPLAAFSSSGPWIGAGGVRAHNNGESRVPLSLHVTRYVNIPAAQSGGSSSIFAAVNVSNDAGSAGWQTMGIGSIGFQFLG